MMSYESATHPAILVADSGRLHALTISVPVVIHGTLESKGTMKTTFLAAILATASMSAVAVEVGVSVNIGQPGFYGQINLGSNMVPQLVLPQPVLIAPPPTGVVLAPLYLRVPITLHQGVA